MWIPLLWFASGFDQKRDSDNDDDDDDDDDDYHNGDITWTTGTMTL